MRRLAAGRRAGSLLAGLVLLVLTLLAPPLAAQGLGTLIPGASAPEEEAPAEPVSPAPQVGASESDARAGPPAPDARIDAEDLQAWERIASRAASLSEGGSASDFALRQLRRELTAWRDRFLAEQTLNAGRLATIDAQIAALGPEDADVGPQIAALRAQLLDERRRLAAPRLIAAARLAQASGLLSEIDALAGVRQAEQLFARGRSPLNPALWPAAAAGLADGVQAVTSEIGARLTNPARWQELGDRAGGLGLALLVALLFLFPTRHWLERLGPARLERPRARLGRALIGFAQLLLPILGLLLLAAILDQSGLFGNRSEELIVRIPQAGISIIAANWLAKEIFGHGPATGAGMDEAQRHRAARLAGWLGWLLALSLVLRAFLPAVEMDGEVAAVLRYPIHLALALVLFQLGRSMSAAPVVDEEWGSSAYRQGLLRFLGQAAMAAAVIGAVLATGGYANAAQSVLGPTILTLALIGFVVLLQRLVGDLYATLVAGGEETGDGSGPLLPVLIALILALLAVPVLALIWGARVEDLMDLWVRFREGYTLGESRISPTDFLIFLLLFAIGYALTRLFQSTLRAAVLPRTRLDVGARNAIVSGVGYVGIFLAALIAIVAVGVDLSSLAIVAGALTVGVGFGLQTIVSNFVSGIILLIERPISEGDWIEAGDQMGIVRAISVRSTRIETFDRRDVIIPNADLVAGQVTNWTRGNAVGRLIVKVGVAYAADAGRVDAILREIAEAQPQVILTPPPQILFMGFGASSLDFEIRVILREIGTILEVQNNLHHAIHARFREEGIEIPFTQADLWLRNPEVLPGNAGAAQEAGEETR
ncbi:DUF3772 domain-containing protein [Pseudoroseicyclus tamaricis]|uniref:DUF3772 domain-containing protein n=1 Tax=Pseudoroseicyclus tamaricis TaxID=2705421 RepID=A0A6B2JHH3_9RHOB|nr:DUF3772 domain-containing protein [Pseudoroseicyclus tamaricis]NDV00741.1 DUF3772 domain-containing protein [Pseudoroseicyclus tamaricis]